MQVKIFDNAPVFNELQKLAIIVQTGTIEQIAEKANNLKALPLFASKGWQININKFINVVKTLEPSFTVIKTDGNSKLGKMAAFSTLPGVTCPGAGDCLSHCYSYTAWRYPAAVFRQAQNALLMRFNKAAIMDSFASLPDNVTFRLYVDGDYSSVSDVSFWQSLLITRPSIKAYGYSKSFQALIDFKNNGGQFATNYLLNISGGSNASEKTLAQANALPVTRAAFAAVNIGRKVKSVEHGTPATNKALRTAYKAAGNTDKPFTCAGKCNACTPKGHACGLPSFKGINIIIAVH